MTQDRRTSGSTDSSLFERAEALIDEAVGRAAKGSYGEAAEKAQQALAIDPDNTVARELLDSYRHQVTDDDERRRRRRSIAAAAAAIEEMVESERLDEASSATDALVMQFGLDAPVEDLRQRIAEARASQLEVDDVDAAFDKIRVGDGRPQQAPRNEPGGAVAAEIEEHLRAGRLDQANRALARLEAEPAAIERAAKLRTRVEEALSVAAEHRREGEILIATAAIEDRIRQGNIDDAAVQLADLARRHGDNAPLAELNQRLVEARALGRQTTGDAGDADLEAGDPFAPPVASAPFFQSMIDEESSGRGRLIAIVVAVVIALAAGAWWLTQRDGEAAAPPATENSATDGAAASAEVPASGDLDVSPSLDAGSAGSTGALAAAPPVDPAAARVPPTASGSAAVAPPAVANAPQSGSSPAAATDRAATTTTAPAANVTAAEEAPPAAPPTSPNANDTAPPPAVEEARSAIADTAPPPADNPPTAEVVVEAVPASASPPPAPAPPPPEPAAPPSAAVAAPAPAESAASSAPANDNSARPEPAANQQQAAVAEPPRAAAPPPAAATRPALLGCGDPGVVCVKALQVPQPKYPAAGRARRLSGSVVVMALVDESGRVVQTRVDSGSFAFFNEAAIEAAKRATFQPATRQGVPGQSWARLTFKFDQP